jgi:hypothetical protein
MKITDIINLSNKNKLMENEVFYKSTEFPKIAKKLGIQTDTLKWLCEWTMKASPYPTDEIIKDLVKYVPQHPINIYRVINFNDIQNEPKKRLRSYVKDDAQKQLMWAEDAGRSYLEVWSDCPPDKILVDMSMICSVVDLSKYLLPDEVVVKGY